jgi:hypothetical protein
MLEGLPVELLQDLDVVALGLIVVWMIATGRLVTRREHVDALHDRDEWRSEARLKDAQIAEKDRQLGHMEQVGRTVEQFTRGLQQEMDR